MSKACRTVSSEVFCIITGLTPVDTKIQEASQLYQLNESNREDDVILERNIGVKDWQHPAETITILKESNESTSPTQIYTDGSKTEHGVGAGIAIFRFGKHLKNLKNRD